MRGRTLATSPTSNREDTRTRIDDNRISTTTTIDHLSRNGVIEAMAIGKLPREQRSAEHSADRCAIGHRR